MDIQETYLFPYARKGLANNIPEEDVFGNVSGNEALAKMRASLTIHTKYKASAVDEENLEKEDGKAEDKELLHDKEIGLYGPADVSSISTAAILKCRPAAGSEGFPPEYFPYIEFREPDFPWRYTPAKVKDNKLTPWLALIVLEKDIVTVQNDDNKLPVVKFNGDKDAYQAAFPKMSELWKTAHAQSPKRNVPLFSRILSLRGIDPDTGIIPALKSQTDYMVCLVPTYETGRLRGLGVEPKNLYGITAQAPAWEDYDIQKSKQRGMEFPVYYSWSFRSGEASFEKLVESLQVVKSGKAGLAVDVTHMGNGFDYEAVYGKKGPDKKVRKTITIPAATKPQPPEPEEAAFPDKTNEKDLYTNLQTLLKSSYIFLENAADIGQKVPKGGPDDGDDPCVVPPVYGARHILATKLDQQPWMNKINMDVHYRIAAGLGRKAVMENQEMLMDRAWKQVEAIQALNMELYRRLLSMGANNALHGKTVGQYGKDNKYLASMMFYLSSMSEAYKEKGDPTLASILEERDVPRAFATPSFHGMTDRVAKIVADLDTKSVMENILEYQTYRFPDHKVEGSYHISSLKKYSEDAFTSISDEIVNSKILKHYIREELPSYISYDDSSSKYQIKYLKLPEMKLSFEGYSYSGGPYENRPVTVTGGHFKTSIGSCEKTPDFDDIFQCISSPLSWLKLFFNHTKTTSITSAQSNYKDEIIKLFFDKGYDQRNCIGFIFDYAQLAKDIGEGEYQYRDKEMLFYPYSSEWSERCKLVDENLYMSLDSTHCWRANLLVIRNGLYKSLFGSIPVTCLEMNGQTFYLADYNYFKESRASQIKNNKKVTVGFLYNVPMKENLQLSDGSMPPPETTFYFSESVGPFGASIPCSRTATYSGTYLYDWIEGFPDINSIWPTDLRDPYHTYRERAEDYIRNTPSAVKIDLKDIPKKDIQSFASKDEYREFLRKRTEDSLLPYMEMWNQFNNLILQLEKDYPEKKEEEKPKQNDKGTEEIKDNLRNTTPYDDSIDILTDFYSAHYSNSETGAKLRGKYIDELLMSKYPILAYPIFPEPTYKYLKEFSEEFVIPGIGDIPMDSVSVFSTNPSFIESYLAGLNTEMGRELLWREYPTDQRGSYFRKFWDSEVSMKDIVDDNFYDITPVHTWTGELGTNMKEGKDSLLIFAIKGRLMKLYPTTRICLWPAKLVSKNKIDFDKSATFDNKKILQPIMESFLNEDVLMVGFKIDPATALGNPANNEYGYFLTFIEDVEDLNFTMEKDDDLSHPDAGLIADALKNDPSYYGKHVSLFIK